MNDANAAVGGWGSSRLQVSQTSPQIYRGGRATASTGARPSHRADGRRVTIAATAWWWNALPAPTLLSAAQPPRPSLIGNSNGSTKNGDSRVLETHLRTRAGLRVAAKPQNEWSATREHIALLASTAKHIPRFAVVAKHFRPRRSGQSLDVYV